MLIWFSFTRLSFSLAQILDMNLHMACVSHEATMYDAQTGPAHASPAFVVSGRLPSEWFHHEGQ
jgi:hypothetical protein